MNYLAIDIFSHKPTLNINGAGAFKTHFGIFLSYFIIGLYLSAFYFFGRDLFFSENPNIIYSENTMSTLKEPIKIDYLSKNFQIYFAAYENSKIVSIDQSYFKIYTNLIHYDRLPEGDFIRKIEGVDMDTCSDRNSGNEPKLRDYLSPLNFSKLHCFKKPPGYEKEGPNKYIQGALGNSNYSYLSVTIARCTNSSSSNITCASLEEIERKANTVIFGGLFVNNFVDPNSYSNAKDTAVEWFSRAPIKAFTPAVKMKFQKGKIVTDRGWIFSDEVTEEIISLKESQEIASSLSTDNITLVRFDLLSYTSECTYQRRYRKVQEVFASVGGVMKLVVTIISIFMHFYVKAKFEFDIVRLLCETNEKRVSRLSQAESNFSFRNFVVYKTGLFRFLFKSNKADWRKYNMAVSKIKSKMDFIKILRKSVEVERIKKTIFPNKAELLRFHFDCSMVFWDFFKEGKKETEKNNELSLQFYSKIGRTFSTLRPRLFMPTVQLVSEKPQTKLNNDNHDDSEENIVKSPEEINAERPRAPQDLVSDHKPFDT